MEYHRSKEKRLFKRKKERGIPPGANTTEGLNKMRAKICHLYLNE